MRKGEQGCHAREWVRLGCGGDRRSLGHMQLRVCGQTLICGCRREGSFICLGSFVCLESWTPCGRATTERKHTCAGAYDQYPVLGVCSGCDLRAVVKVLRGWPRVLDRRGWAVTGHTPAAYLGLVERGRKAAGTHTSRASSNRHEIILIVRHRVCMGLGCYVRKGAIVTLG